MAAAPAAKREAARAGARRHGRGDLYRRRVRHRDSVGARIERARDLAAPERLSDSGRRASKALAPYIKQQLKFFVAKVNLKEQAKTGAQYLRPLQFTFELRALRAADPPGHGQRARPAGPRRVCTDQATAASRSTNYRTVKLPANMDVPVYLRGEFGTFYKALFDEQARRESLSRRLHRVLLGHELVRSVRGRPVLAR